MASSLSYFDPPSSGSQIALVTPFSKPASCSQIPYIADQSTILAYPQATPVIRQNFPASCLPPEFLLVDYTYSPGMCFSGYTTLVSAVSAGTTSAYCCPSGDGWVAYGNVCAKGFTTPQVVERYYTDSSLYTTTILTTYLIETDAVHVFYQQKDLSLFPSGYTPGTVFPSITESPTVATISSTAPFSTSTPTLASTPTPTHAPDPSPLGTGARAGIGVGATVGVALIGLVLFFWWRHRISRRKKNGPSAIDKTSYYGTAILFSGPLVIFGVVAFLSFLWAADFRNMVWRSIMIANWATRSITLASLVLRWTISAQAVLCTAMLAALALEGAGVRLAQAPGVSILRYGNTGPLALLTLLWKTLVKGRAIFVCCLISTLLLTTSLLQFSSTVLLSDIKPDMTPGHLINRTVPYGLDINRPLSDVVDNVYQGPSYWQSRPPVYPVFAESSSPPNITDGIYDTRRSMRALFPISSPTSRATLKDYSGTASVFDSRVLCLRPTSDIAIHFIQEFPSFGPNDTTAMIYLNGLVGTSLGADRLSMPMSDVKSVPVNCTAGLPPTDEQVYGGKTERAVTLCRLRPEYGGIVTAFLAPPTDDSGYGLKYLVMSVEGTPTDWQAATTQNQSFQQGSNGEWATFRNERGLYLNISLCFADYTQVDMEIEASSATNRSEPVLDWDTSLSYYNVTAIKHWMGATNEYVPPLQRGLLALHDPSSWIHPLNNKTLPFAAPAAEMTWQAINADITIPMCTYCSQWASGPYLSVHRTQVALFNDILRSTNHPALAIQAHGTIAVSMAYYDLQLTFDTSDQVAFSFFQLVPVPSGWRGFQSVMAVLAIHLLLVFLISFLFISSTRASLLGNAWLTLAQGYSDDTKPWLDKADFEKDSSMETKIQAAGEELVYVGLGLDHDKFKLRRRGS